MRASSAQDPDNVERNERFVLDDEDRVAAKNILRHGTPPISCLRT